jgi:hypothetical protein
MYEVGGAEVWRITGTGYPIGTPKKDAEEWTSEWFYIEDAPYSIQLGGVCPNSHLLLRRNGSTGIRKVLPKRRAPK